MKRKDYVVVTNGEEIIFNNLTEARKYAKKTSKQEETDSTISLWIYDADMDDMVLDEKFEVVYINGKDTQKD